jgi:hypothetical protein
MEKKRKEKKDRKKVCLIFYPHLQSIYLLFPSFNRVTRKPIAILIYIYKKRKLILFTNKKDRELLARTLKVIFSCPLLLQP